jgi:hypothetical protein
MLTLLIACVSGGDKPPADSSPVDSAAPEDTARDSGDDSGDEDSGGSDSGTDDSGVPDTDDDGWPSRFVAPYVDATAYPTLKIGELFDANGDVRHYVLGFVVAQTSTSCTASWGTYYSVDVGPSAWEGGSEYTLYEQIAALRGIGGDVMVSFGGAANTPIEAACTTVEATTAEYARVVDALSLTRVDFDVEGAWLSHPESTARRSEAIAALQARQTAAGRPLRVWFTLPVLPTGLTADGLAVMQSALDHGVEVAGVNVMTMNYGDGTAPDPDGRMGAYGIDAITALHAQLDTLYGGSRTDAERWAMIGTTPMIGQNDVASEVFTLEDAALTRSFATEKGVGMVSLWSANRDRSCAEPSSWARSDCHGLTDVVDWAFTRALAGSAR